MKQGELTVGMSEFHWAMQVMDTIDVGLVVVDREYNVCLWNSFMQGYSGVRADKIMSNNLFSVIDGLPEQWLKSQIDSCAELGSRSFSNWEDRPFIFEFVNYSPISNGMDVMYQNLVLTPLKSLNGEISHVCLMIQDVSDIAKNKITLRESNAHLSEISQQDGLTGLFNRSYWESRFAEEYQRSSITDQCCSVVVLDIDHFKKVNDNYGHAAGDEVIRQTAKALLLTARRTDVCGRYGGEEFVALLPDTTADQAKYFAERMRKRIEALIVKTETGDISFTISLGIAQLNSDILSHLEWFECADKALYFSKEHGRNQSSTYQEGV
ncbi:GGDEF domain-containing protein [Vibrio sp. RC27]